MKSYLVEVEQTRTIRQRTQVVVTTQSNILDESVMNEIKCKADEAIKKGGNSVVWTDVAETQRRSKNPKYTIYPKYTVSSVLIAP